jgi:Tol biopolymer transport system component
LTTFSGLDSLSSPTFYFPDWSSDGKNILFDEPLGEWGGIFNISSDFTQSERIGDHLYGGDPEFSPTNPNLFIYYRGGHDVAASEIFTFDIPKLKEVRLTQNSRDDRAPTWSPNGQKIAWSGSLVLSVMNADGTHAVDIGYGNDPSWSVNDQIVFSYANSDYTKEVLYLTSPDGTNRRQITF